LREAKRDLRKAKARYEVAKAEVRLAVNGDPGKFGLTKGTVAEVDAAVTIDKRVRKALEELHEAEYAIDIYSIQVNAREERRRNLEDLVKLHGQDYFSDPRISGSPEIKSRVQEAGKRAADRQINKALNRKRTLKTGRRKA